MGGEKGSEDGNEGLIWMGAAQVKAHRRYRGTVREASRLSRVAAYDAMVMKAR
jgi:hypothetical protein